MRPRNIIPILLAFLLNRILSKKTKQKIQLVLYMPNFISVIVLCGIVRIMLSPTGMINSCRLGLHYLYRGPFQRQQGAQGSCGH